MPIVSKNLLAFYKKFDCVAIYVNVGHLLYVQNNPRHMDFNFFLPGFCCFCSLGANLQELLGHTFNK